MRLLEYYRARFRHPELRDFAGMGLGIEARYLRCKGYWKRHLEYSRAFQAECLSRYPGDSVAVFGAGRLLDLPVDSIRRSFRTMEFFDADPTARESWRDFEATLRAEQKLHKNLSDITGSLADWSARVEKSLRLMQPAEAENFASMLSGLEPGKVPDSRFDCSISLNILSQLGIYWRERVERMIESRKPAWVNAQGLLEPVIEAALVQSIRRLEEQHLQMLARCTEQLIVIITDVFFLYYQREQAFWQEEPALEVSLDQGLEGWKTVAQDTWLWHIAPQGIESPDHGAIHQVRALAYVPEER